MAFPTINIISMYDLDLSTAFNKNAPMNTIVNILNMKNYENK